MATNTDQTINAYRLYDDIYDSETIEFWENFPKSTLRAFRKKLPGVKVLNLGSGPG